MPSSASAAGLGVGPTVLLASQLSSTTFQVVFSEPMSSTGLTTTGNYALTANGGSTVRTVNSVVVMTSSSVLVTASGALSVGTSAYTVTVTGLADLVGNPINTSANTATLTIVGTSNVAQSRNGGTYVTLALPTIVAPGRYRVYIGQLGTAADPRASSRVSGEAEIVRLAVGQTEVSVAVPPALSVGNGRQATFVAVDPTASPTSFISTTLVDYLPRQYFSSCLSMRRLFPSRYDIGTYDPANEAPQ